MENKQIKVKKNKLFSLKFENKRQVYALLFILPWLIGFIIFFVFPLIKSFVLTFQTQSGDSFVPNGIGNYKKLFGDFTITYDNKEYTMVRIILETLQEILFEMPLIIIFSLFIAVILNQKFRGRGVVRTIFFLPIVFSSGVVAGLIQSNNAGGFLEQVISNQPLYKALDITYLFKAGGIPESVVNVLSSAAGQVFKVISYSGVQILIFLSALQSISPTLYEVGKIEGANSYESFWKITLPSIMPMIIATTVYTFVDVVARSKITYIIRETEKNAGLGSINLASTISIIFLGITVVLLGVIVFILGRMYRSGKR